MSSEWPMQTLESLAKEVTVGYVGPMADEYVENGVPFLRSLNIQPFRISTNDLKYVTAEFHQKIRKSALRPGDVAIVRTGKPGTCAVIPEWLVDANCSDLVIVRCGPSIRPQFLCYWVNSVASHHISSHLVGAVQQHFNVGAAKVMKVAVPSLREQNCIIGVLGSLDDRITLLRETNTTLEAIAQALFKSWFVDFDPVRAKQQGRVPEGMDEATAALFPDGFEESELGLVPRGWRVGTLADLMRLHKGSVNPGAHPDAEFQHFSLPAFDAGQMPIFESGSAIKSNKTTVPENAVLLSKLNPHIPRVWLPSFVGERAVCSTEFLPFVPTASSTTALVYCLLAAPDFSMSLCQLVTGTSNSHQRVKPDGVLSLPSSIPSRDVVTAFDSLAKVLLARLRANRVQAQTLTTLRDTLLPRLISGQLRLPEVEVQLAEGMA